MIFCEKDTIKIILSSGENETNYINFIDKLDTLFKKETIDEIIIINIFEKLNPYKSMGYLGCWFNLLKKGGKITIESVNIEALAKLYFEFDEDSRFEILNYIYQPNSKEKPLFGWWPDSIRDHLFNSGFINIVIGPEEIPHPPPNFRVEAEKPC